METATTNTVRCLASEIEELAERARAAGRMSATADHIQTLENPLGDGLVFQIHGAELFAVPSDTTSRIYSVILVPGAKPSCNCPATVPCKHIRRVLAARAGF
ncbi:MAG TPA: hypothetical protein VE645_18960 [Pseudonocardiaceae bacterium]|jgi:hypothetical protein|nr:hypothetical protein [Pseudonocardiaceae bacterium]